jgi:tRNA (guanine37-N1)-methyltransferase
MILKPEPFFRAVESLADELGQRPRVVLTSARGGVFDQAKARELARQRAIVMLCGRYQGVDERVSTIVDEELTIGDFVLSGGELPALVMAEAIGRLVPGVVGNLDSLDADSFAASELLGPPQYTRPVEFRGMRVPEVLLSGDHAEIERWRREQALATTRRNRPDLVDQADRLTDVD